MLKIRKNDNEILDKTYLHRQSDYTPKIAVCKHLSANNLKIFLRSVFWWHVTTRNSVWQNQEKNV